MNNETKTSDQEIQIIKDFVWKWHIERGLQGCGSGMDFDDIFHAIKDYNEPFKSHITNLETENFKLAAYQCDKPYGDDYGNKRCTYQDRILELEAINKELEELALPILEYFDRGLGDVEEGSGEEQPMHKEIKQLLNLIKK